MTEDEIVGGGHHQLDGREFEQALGIDDGQGSLLCCSPWGHKESDMIEQLKNKTLSRRDPSGWRKRRRHEVPRSVWPSPVWGQWRRWGHSR